MSAKNEKKKGRSSGREISPKLHFETEVRDLVDAAAARAKSAGSGDAFFADVANTNAYVKVGIMGMAGTGKTFTMSEIAIGLWKRVGSKKPVTFFDTENSARFLRKVFRDAGIELKVRRGRSMGDLMTAMNLCREGYSDILLIDSITHVWEDFIDTYRAKKAYEKWRANAPEGRSAPSWERLSPEERAAYRGRAPMEMMDWGVVKPTWKRVFSEPFVAAPFSILFTGRAGYEYDTEIDEETRKRTFFKSGIKMKVEGETAYEPDILVLMERFEQLVKRPGAAAQETNADETEKKVWREATIIKDRNNVIDGETFRNPTYEDFSPAIEEILDSPVAEQVVTHADAGGLFATEEGKRAFLRERDIELESIEAAIVASGLGGQTGEAKKKKVEIFKRHFATASWTAITQLPPARLRAARIAIEVELGLAPPASGEPAGTLPPESPTAPDAGAQTITQDSEPTSAPEPDDPGPPPEHDGVKVEE